MSTIELIIAYHEGIIAPDESDVDFDTIMNELTDQLPLAGATVAMNDLVKQGYATDPTLVGEDAADWVREMLDPKDYVALGKSPSDVPMLTYGELYRIGKPIPIGGAGTAVQYVIDLISSDNAVVMTTITALTTVIHKIIALYVGRNQNKKLILKDGGVEIHLNGYSTKEAKKAADEFIATRLGSQITSDQDQGNNEQDQGNEIENGV